MHKYDFYIQDYLLSEGTLSAENIGEFQVVKKQEGNGAATVSFTYNKHAGTTQELVAYIAGKEHKSKVVIGFDLEAHFNEIRQFMNTGKPWVVPAIGQLQMNRNREYELVPQEQEEMIAQERKRVMQSSQPSNEYGLQRAEPRNSNRAGGILLAILVIAGLVFAGYYLYTNNPSAAAASNKDTAATQTDTMVQQVPSPSNVNNTTTATVPPAVEQATPPAAETTASPAATGMMDIRFVIAKTTDKDYIHKRYNQLKSYGITLDMDSVSRDTSTLYKLYLAKTLTPADTARIKDSLAIYFGKPVKIEQGKK